MPPELPSVIIPSSLSKSFYPVLDAARYHRGVSELYHSPSSLGDAGTDSPVLPSDGDNDQVISSWNDSSRLRGPGHAFVPSAADMDALGMFAGQPFDANSVRSIPTSFVSGGIADSIINHESFALAGTTRRRMARRSYSSPSLSLNLSTDTLDLPDNLGTDDGLSMQRPRNLPYIDTRQHKNFISTTVDGGAPKVNNGQLKNRSSRFWNLKTLGQKVKQAFSFKSKSEPFIQDIGVTTTTAITSVEYTSVSRTTLVNLS